jgi:hypothetical protein
MIVDFLTRFYSHALRAFPSGFREEYQDEMADIFRQRLEEAAAEGTPAMLALFLRETGGLLAGGLRRRLASRPDQALMAATDGAEVLVGIDPYRPSLMKIVLVAFGLGLLAFLCYIVYAFATFSFEGPPRVQEVALGDLNGDGRPDAYLAVAPDGEPYVHPDYLLLNEGGGQFRESGHDFGDWPSMSVALEDVNADGHTDVVLSRYGVSLLLNDGQAAFRNFPRLSVPDATGRTDVALADLNGDGHPDLFGASCCGGAMQITSNELRPLVTGSQVWLNDSDGFPFAKGQLINRTGSNAVALADLNGDGTIDAFLANGTTQVLDEAGQAVAVTSVDAVLPEGQSRAYEVSFERNTPDTVWFNGGQGNFTDSGQRLGTSEGMAVALGDVNGDGFPDAVVGVRGPDEVWLNDGRGVFADSGQRLGDGLTRSVFLVDLDGDGDLDLVTGGETDARCWPNDCSGEASAHIWLNDGSGVFSAGFSGIDYDSYGAITVGDADGDGIADILVAEVGAFQLWRGQGDGRFTAYPRGTFEVTFDASQ